MPAHVVRGLVDSGNRGTCETKRADAMTKMTRRAALRAIASAGGLLGIGAAAGCGGRGIGSMMGGATAGVMSDYMELFARHEEIRRTVEAIPGGVRTVTESDAP